MDRVKTFEATGEAPNGKLFAGDLNEIQDAAAGQSDFSQEIDAATYGIGDETVLLTKYADGVARLTASLRLDGTLTALGGLLPGTFTTTQRNAISAPSALLIIYNSTTTQFEYNAGTSDAPVWLPLTSSGNLLGQPIEWPGLDLPNFGTEVYAWNDGSAISRTTYANYMAKITKTLSGVRTSGSKIITGLSSTAGMAHGMPVEGTGIGTSSVIDTVDSGTQVTLTVNATASGTSNITVFPWGNGDASTTFNMPDKRGRSWVGLAMSGGHADMSGMGKTEGVSASLRRMVHRHTNGLTGSTTLANHVHPAAVSAVEVIYPGGSAAGGAIGFDGGSTSTPGGITVTIGNPTTNPTMAVTFGGMIGVSSSDALDATPYAVMGSCSRIA